MRYLTTDEQNRAKAWAKVHLGTSNFPLLDSEPSGLRLAPQRIQVVNTEPERTYTAYDLDTERQHRAELGTHAPGPPLNLTTRSQRRQVYGELVAFTVIGGAALVGLFGLAWLVRYVAG